MPFCCRYRGVDPDGTRDVRKGPVGQHFEKPPKNSSRWGRLHGKRIGMRVECPLSQFEQLFQDLVAIGANEVCKIAIGRKYKIPLHRIETLVIGQVAFV